MSPDLSGFYGTCAQIIPALLIVVALETKTASRVVGEARAAPETAARLVDWLEARRDEVPRWAVAAMKMFVRNWGRSGHLTRVGMHGVIWFGLLCELSWHSRSHHLRVRYGPLRSGCCSLASH